MAISPTANGGTSRPMTLAPPSLGRPRKYSLPVIYPRPSLSVYAAETTKESVSRRRKFSQVGQVVGHRLSTIGWRSPISQLDVVNQGKSLCGKYLRTKLRSCSVVHKKLGLQRLKSVSNLACGSNTAEIANELRLLTGELESSHPKLFSSVVSNVGLHGGPPSEAAVHNVFAAVAHEIFRCGTTWGRVVALFAMTGALAVDCVKAGHPEYVLGLVQKMGVFMESDLAAWIAQQGGWATLLTRFKKDSQCTYTKEAICSLIGLALLLIIALWWILR